MAKKSGPYNQPQITVNGKTHNGILSALAHISKLEAANKKEWSFERNQEILQLQDKISEIRNAALNAPARAGREQKTYREDPKWDFHHVSHTYDADGNKIQVGDTVTYLTGSTFWRIESIILNNDATERIRIRRSTGLTKNMVHGTELHKFTV